jgi:unsaturated rhamnogalacturonyl hydrolase
MKHGTNKRGLHALSLPCALLGLWYMVSIKVPVTSIADRVADWQITHVGETPNSNSPTGWVRSSFYIGLAEWAKASNENKYFDYLRHIGQQNHWKLGPRTYSADDQAIAQAYVAAFDHFADPVMIKPMTKQFDYILAHKPRGSLEFSGTCRRWCWSDALFMAPASWFALARIKSDSRYRDFADSEFWTTVAALFDENQHLFYRDSRYTNQGVFWSRGNGWAFAGLINIINNLSGSDAKYKRLLQQMADRIIRLQRADGFWSTSLLTKDSGIQESSGTAFFIYGLAAGIKMGILDQTKFGGHALRGWKALVSATHDGRLGWVQQIGDRPNFVRESDTQLFGSGGFLLAASAISALRD